MIKVSGLSIVQLVMDDLIIATAKISIAFFFKNDPQFFSRPHEKRAYKEYSFLTDKELGILPKLPP